MVGEAGEGLARDSRVGRVSIAALALFLTRASFLTAHRVGRVDGFVISHAAVVFRLPNSFLQILEFSFSVVAFFSLHTFESGAIASRAATYRGIRECGVHLAVLSVGCHLPWNSPARVVALYTVETSRTPGVTCVENAPGFPRMQRP